MPSTPTTTTTPEPADWYVEPPEATPSTTFPVPEHEEPTTATAEETDYGDDGDDDTAPAKAAKPAKATKTHDKDDD